MFRQERSLFNFDGTSRDSDLFNGQQCPNAMLKKGAMSKAAENDVFEKLKIRRRVSIE